MIRTIIIDAIEEIEIEEIEIEEIETRIGETVVTTTTMTTTDETAVAFEIAIATRAGASVRCAGDLGDMMIVNTSGIPGRTGGSGDSSEAAGGKKGLQPQKHQEKGGIQSLPLRFCLPWRLAARSEQSNRPIDHYGFTHLNW